MRTPVLHVFLLLAAAGLTLSPAYAQRTKTIVPPLDAEGHKGDMARAAQKKANERFDKADVDKDGQISKEEAMAAMPFVGEHFEKYDKDNDGKMTWEEFLGHDKWKREESK